MTATRWEAMKNPAARTKGDPKYQVREPDGWPVALVWQERDLPLVAAAPELLEALLRLLDDECVQFASDAETCECGPNGNGADDAGNVCGHIQARRAIAKATGQ